MSKEKQNKQTDIDIPTSFRENVLNDPEYKRYCEYYNFTDIDSDKCIMGFYMWKSFGMGI